MALFFTLKSLIDLELICYKVWVWDPPFFFSPFTQNHLWNNQTDRDPRAQTSLSLTAGETEVHKGKATCPKSLNLGPLTPGPELSPTPRCPPGSPNNMASLWGDVWCGRRRPVWACSLVFCVVTQRPWTSPLTSLCSSDMGMNSDTLLLRAAAKTHRDDVCGVW